MGTTKPQRVAQISQGVKVISGTVNGFIVCISKNTA